MPLAFYSRAATQEFWSEHWGGQDVPGLLRVARGSPLTALIEAALPAGGRMLEAGCGLGQYVVLLRERGRAVIGADWSLDALRRGRAAAPATPLTVMDLARLALRPGALDAYISLGVVEHDPGGPDAIVAEAARVLAPGGRLVLSVPYWNGARRLTAPYLLREARRLRAAGGQFYQFAFSRREMRAFLEAHGFHVLRFHPYDPARLFRGAVRRWLPLALDGDVAAAGAPTTRGGPFGDHVGAGRRLRGVLKRLLYSPPALRLFAHMILAVAVKR